MIPKEQFEQLLVTLAPFVSIRALPVDMINASIIALVGPSLVIGRYMGELDGGARILAAPLVDALGRGSLAEYWVPFDLVREMRTRTKIYSEVPRV